MKPTDSLKFSEVCGAGLVAANAVSEELHPQGAFKVVCRAADGTIRWEEDFLNLVVTVGKNDLLDKYFRASAYTAAFYVGLKGAGTIAAGDTMSSHAGWSEITGYSNATRPAFTAAAASAGSTSNTASPASFSINATNTVAGCFITTDNTKGGTTGVLFSAADFAASRSVISGDTLSVTYTISC